MDYRRAGVDIEAGNEVVRRIRSLARTTFTPAVLSDIGSFGGLYRLDRDACRDPVLVSSADGVGTKLKVAFLTGRHDTIGADLVNHCVNDILVQGARPLFFLDYLATGRLSPDVAEQVLVGVVDVCTEDVESPDVVAARIRAALQHVPAARLMPCTDCGLVPRSRESARGKMRALAAGAAIVRAELGGDGGRRGAGARNYAKTALFP